MVDDCISYAFTWHSHADAKVCQKCQTLNGRTWSDQDLFQKYLWDPIWGDIWDLDADHSLAHGSGPHNCRCQLEVRVICKPEILEEYVTFEELMRQL